MMNYLDCNYSRNFISQVIIRVDFLEFVPTERLFSDALINEIIKKFPKKGMQQVIRFEDVSVFLEPDTSTTKRKTEEGLQQQFSNSENNKIILSNKFFVLEINAYSNYENTIAMMEPVFRSILSSFQLTSVRTGIRYINIYEDGQIRLTKNLFSTDIGTSVNLKLSEDNNGLNCLRSMTLREYKFNDMRVNFRFGMYNPEFPNLMRHANFVLDYDCFCEEQICGYDAIMNHIEEGHNAIQHLFETSISDKLKGIMKSE